MVLTGSTVVQSRQFVPVALGTKSPSLPSKLRSVGEQPTAGASAGALTSASAIGEIDWVSSDVAAGGFDDGVTSVSVDGACEVFAATAFLATFRVTQLTFLPLAFAFACAAVQTLGLVTQLTRLPLARAAACALVQTFGVFLTAFGAFLAVTAFVVLTPSQSMEGIAAPTAGRARAATTTVRIRQRRREVPVGSMRTFPCSCGEIRHAGRGFDRESPPDRM